MANELCDFSRVGIWDRDFFYTCGLGKRALHAQRMLVAVPQPGCYRDALLGALLYDLAIFTGPESPINYMPRECVQSTPARIGLRMLNSTDRKHFWSSSLPRTRQGLDDGSREEDRAAAQLGKEVVARRRQDADAKVESDRSDGMEDEQVEHQSSWMHRSKEKRTLAAALGL